MSDVTEDVRAEVAFSEAIRHIVACAKASPDGAMMACQAWIETHGAGIPQVALIAESARSEARFWADTASPIELECYMVAAVDRLASLASMAHGRQIKRLIAALWARMSPDERKGFLLWVKQQHEAGK
jgi:hypothetical protein